MDNKVGMDTQSVTVTADGRTTTKREIGFVDGDSSSGGEDLVPGSPARKAGKRVRIYGVRLDDSGTWVVGGTANVVNTGDRGIVMWEKVYVDRLGRTVSRKRGREEYVELGTALMSGMPGQRVGVLLAGTHDSQRWTVPPPPLLPPLVDDDDAESAEGAESEEIEVDDDDAENTDDSDAEEEIEEGEEDGDDIEEGADDDAGIDDAGIDDGAGRLHMEALPAEILRIERGETQPDTDRVFARILVPKVDAGMDYKGFLAFYTERYENLCLDGAAPAIAEVIAALTAQIANTELSATYRRRATLLRVGIRIGQITTNAEINNLKSMLLAFDDIPSEPSRNVAIELCVSLAMRNDTYFDRDEINKFVEYGWQHYLVETRRDIDLASTAGNTYLKGFENHGVHYDRSGLERHKGPYDWKRSIDAQNDDKGRGKTAFGVTLETFERAREMGGAPVSNVTDARIALLQEVLTRIDINTNPSIDNAILALKKFPNYKIPDAPTAIQIFTGDHQMRHGIPWVVGRGLAGMVAMLETSPDTEFIDTMFTEFMDNFDESPYDEAKRDLIINLSPKFGDRNDIIPWKTFKPVLNPRATYDMSRKDINSTYYRSWYEQLIFQCRAIKNVMREVNLDSVASEEYKKILESEEKTADLYSKAQRVYKTNKTIIQRIDALIDKTRSAVVYANLSEEIEERLPLKTMQEYIDAENLIKVGRTAVHKAKWEECTPTFTNIVAEVYIQNPDRRTYSQRVDIASEVRILLQNICVPKTNTIRDFDTISAGIRELTTINLPLSTGKMGAFFNKSKKITQGFVAISTMLKALRDDDGRLFGNFDEALEIWKSLPDSDATKDDTRGPSPSKVPLPESDSEGDGPPVPTTGLSAAGPGPGDSTDSDSPPPIGVGVFRGFAGIEEGSGISKPVVDTNPSNTALTPSSRWGVPDFIVRAAKSLYRVAGSLLPEDADSLSPSASPDVVKDGASVALPVKTTVCVLQFGENKVPDRYIGALKVILGDANYNVSDNAHEASKYILCATISGKKLDARLPHDLEEYAKTKPCVVVAFRSMLDQGGADRPLDLHSTRFTIIECQYTTNRGGFINKEYISNALPTAIEAVHPPVTASQAAPLHETLPEIVVADATAAAAGSKKEIHIYNYIRVPTRVEALKDGLTRAGYTIVPDSDDVTAVLCASNTLNYEEAFKRISSHPHRKHVIVYFINTAVKTAVMPRGEFVPYKFSSYERTIEQAEFDMTIATICKAIDDARPLSLPAAAVPVPMVVSAARFTDQTSSEQKKRLSVKKFILDGVLTARINEFNHQLKNMGYDIATSIFDTNTTTIIYINNIQSYKQAVDLIRESKDREHVIVYFRDAAATTHDLDNVPIEYFTLTYSNNTSLFSSPESDNEMRAITAAIDGARPGVSPARKPATLSPPAPRIDAVPPPVVSAPQSAALESIPSDVCIVHLFKMRPDHLRTFSNILTDNCKKTVRKIKDNTNAVRILCVNSTNPVRVKKWVDSNPTDKYIIVFFSRARPGHHELQPTPAGIDAAQWVEYQHTTGKEVDPRVVHALNTAIENAQQAVVSPAPAVQPAAAAADPVLPAGWLPHDLTKINPLADGSNAHGDTDIYCHFMLTPVHEGFKTTVFGFIKSCGYTPKEYNSPIIRPITPHQPIVLLCFPATPSINHQVFLPGIATIEEDIKRNYKNGATIDVLTCSAAEYSNPTTEKRYVKLRVDDVGSVVNETDARNQLNIIAKTIILSRMINTLKISPKINPPKVSHASFDTDLNYMASVLSFLPLTETKPMYDVFDAAYNRETYEKCRDKIVSAFDTMFLHGRSLWPEPMDTRIRGTIDDQEMWKRLAVLRCDVAFIREKEHVHWDDSASRDEIIGIQRKDIVTVTLTAKRYIYPYPERSGVRRVHKTLSPLQDSRGRMRCWDMAALFVATYNIDDPEDVLTIYRAEYVRDFWGTLSDDTAVGELVRSFIDMQFSEADKDVAGWRDAADKSIDCVTNIYTNVCGSSNRDTIEFKESVSIINRFKTDITFAYEHRTIYTRVLCAALLCRHVSSTDIRNAVYRNVPITFPTDAGVYIPGDTLYGFSVFDCAPVVANKLRYIKDLQTAEKLRFEFINADMWKYNAIALRILAI